MKHIIEPDQVFSAEEIKRLVKWIERYENPMLAFTEMPNGANDTMFHYPEAQQQEAYRAFEARAIARCAKEENRLRFKAYIARRYGLRVPLKSQP